MPLYKVHTNLENLLASPIKNALQDGKTCVQYPSFSLAIEALNQYERWVSCMLAPIAFQWIWENHEKVYDGMDKGLQDDVGVVVRAAFALVKKMGAYKASSDELNALKHGKEFDPMKVNPVWRAISKNLREELEKSFEDESKLLHSEKSQE